MNCLKGVVDVLTLLEQCDKCKCSGEVTISNRFRNEMKKLLCINIIKIAIYIYKIIISRLVIRRILKAVLKF